MKHSLGHLERDQVVARARSAVGHNTAYQLGAGGRHPLAGSPGNPCDCSGFVAWCLGIDRYLPNDGLPLYDNGGWFETSAIVRDAKSPFGFVVEVDWSAVVPSDMLVYGDAGKHQGHIGVVSEVGDGAVKVVHCSHGNWSLRGDAVQETNAGIFIVSHAIVARVAWVG